MENREQWRTESSRTKQTAASVVALVVGIVLAIGFRHFEGPGVTESRAGLLLGVMLMAVGAGMLLFGGKQVITVERKARRIVVEHAGRFRKSVKDIPFSEISEVYVGELGDREGGSIRYHIVAKLKTGKEIALFMGFFEGSHSKPAMEARCQRLSECLQSERAETPVTK
jgi:hypothetical protein